MNALSGEKVLITGATGQVALPVALALAADNDLWAIARFGDAGARDRLEKAGVTCVVVDFEQADFAGLPDDFAYVLNFGVAKSNDFDRDLAGNAEATGLLMAHCRSARAFLHCSSTAVYQPVRRTCPSGRPVAVPMQWGSGVPRLKVADPGS